jgi:predicted MFS family arabinose efflux permease
VVEHRAAEPIIPLRLFRNRVFTVGNIYGFLAGIAMFGAIVFLPLYLQAVRGMSPTLSGLAMLPTVIGIFATSIGSGLLITRTGRYKIYPILGAATLVVSLWLLGGLHLGTPYWQLGALMFAFGAGLGLTMQTITTAVQNAVEFRDLGTATSATTFFRSLGGALGAAIFGAVLSTRLTSHLAALMGGLNGAAGAASISANNVEAIQALPDPIKALVQTAFTLAIDDVFRAGIPFVLLALIVAFFLEERTLRTGGPTREEREDAAPLEALAAGL